MKFKILLLCIFFAVNSFAEETSPHSKQAGSTQDGKSTFLVNPNSRGQIQINNRILARINDKAISVADVAKKMDLVFRHQYPQYVNLPTARYTYYMASWRNALQDLIDKELVLADAKEIKMEISHGDVRQEMEEAFGPNILATLNELGLSYEDAWEMIKTDILIRRMMFGRVNIKAMSLVNPKEVRKAYEEYTKQHENFDSWIYHVISIRSADPNKGLEVSQQAYKKLTSGACSLETLNATLHEDKILDDTVSVRVSEQFEHDEHVISPAYREALVKLEIGSCSEPIAQYSRSNNQSIHRIFFLKDKVIAEIPTLQQMENTLRNQLLDEAVAKETDRYLDHLRQRFNASEEVLNELIPDGFEPFSIN